MLNTHKTMHTKRHLILVRESVRSLLSPAFAQTQEKANHSNCNHGPDASNDQSTCHCDASKY